jgi:hypothetical protein
MVASLLTMAGLDWSVPDSTTLCRRQETLAVQIPCRRADWPLNLLVDSTGIKFLGDGEWQARKPGARGRRRWRKVHPAMDMAASDIRAVEFTPGSDGDSPVLPDTAPACTFITLATLGSVVRGSPRLFFPPSDTAGDR